MTTVEIPIRIRVGTPLGARLERRWRALHLKELGRVKSLVADIVARTHAWVRSAQVFDCILLTRAFTQFLTLPLYGVLAESAPG